MAASHYSTPSQWIVLVLFWVLSLSTIQAAATQDTSAHADEIVSTGPERVLWRKTPIAIPLVVGEERLIHFPDSVSIGLPQSLTPFLRSQSINGTLYLLAGQPFESTRVMVRSENGGPLFVLDISAALNVDERPPLAEVQVVLESSKAEVGAVVADTATASRFTQWGYVALTRFAAQQLYAPERLIPNALGVVAIPVKDAPVDLHRGGSVEAVPVAAWKAGLRYVTAVRLTNRTAKAVILDPRELRGAWLAATFQHNRLLPSGSDADTSAVYLISDRPFDVALW
ncbi:TIGR03749 family integrating conjugative element protein [Parahaliea mediterranea]|uniref:TIGR03749 family integrating conjugative element protein n=1 Tax=Parahaliea mediterranea TaxID=651086 RepID=UPI000E2EC51A|nr:TIGR03749 family integrating conjugative element protein [Parahaliea mediterranea]